MGRYKDEGRNRIRTVMAWFMVACLVFFRVPVQGIAAETPETVRVGYYSVANYQEVEEDGTYSGYSYDYYMQIQKYTRWNYEFVEASYSDCVKMLLNGEIDVLAGLGKTPERESQMIFSRYTVSTSQNRMYAKADNTELFFESFDTFDGCTVAMMAGTLTDEVESYAAQHGFQVQIQFYSTMKEMEQALLSGEVDMVCAASISTDMDTKIVARMDRQPLYIVTNQEKPEIAYAIDEALRKITDNNPEFSIQMSEKYKISGANATATFTREELDFINANEEVYLIVNPDWAPISWYDRGTGEYKGIVVDVVRKMEAYSGLRITLCSEAEYDALEAERPELINNVLAVLADDNRWSAKQEVMMSNHIVDSAVVAISKTGSGSTLNEDSVIAISDRFYVGYIMKEELGDKNVVYYEDVQACLDAVNEGKADVTFVNELVSSYYLSMIKYTNLYASANTGYYENLAFAVYKDTNTPLLGIIDKSMLCIGAVEINEIVIANSIANERVTLEGLYYSNPEMVLMIVAIVVLIVTSGIALLYSAFRRRKQAELELQREAELGNARTEFFMMISHELRTPLNAIVGYLNLVAEELKKKGMEMEYVKRSQSASRQLSNIADEMLDYTKIASNSVKLKEEVFDLKEIIRHVDQNISLDAIEKNQSYRIVIDDLSHEYLVGDALRITQIFQNLLSNAVKFTGRGGKVEAHLSEELIDEKTVRLRFTCADTGKGMTEEFVQKICAPFKQSDSAYSRTHGGMGLGLYLTKYYVDSMHGTFHVESTLGVGSTFTVTIALRLPNSQQILDQNINYAHIRAIVASAEEEDHKRYKELLKRLHIKCDAVTEGDKLVKKLQARMGGDYAYALCLIDETIYGKEIVQQIGGLEKPPVIFTLAANMTMLNEMTMDKHIGHVLYKPIFQSVLFDAIMNTFGEYNMEESGTENYDFHEIRAMIVEDNPVNADILTRVLKKVNIEVTICENGQVAVDTFAQAEENFYQLILMDIQMPVMNGYEAASCIRKSIKSQGAAIPIIAISANAFPEDIEKSLEAGMNEHMSKPVNAPKLYEAIRKYCTRE